MKVRFTLIFVLLCVASSIFSQTVLAVRPPDADVIAIQEIDLSTGASVNELAITIPGVNIQGFTSMAYDPVDNQLYVVAKDGQNFHLATLNPNNGTGASVGILPDRIAGLAFSTDGTLYAISGDGSPTSATIYTINPADASGTTLVQTTGGSDGEALSFNPNDGLLYRYGGGGLFQSVDPSTQEITTITTLNNIAAFSHSLTYDAGGEEFLFGAGDILYKLTADGALTQIGSDPTGQGFKGLVYASDIVSSLNPEPVVRFDLFPNPVVQTLNVSLDGFYQTVITEIYDVKGSLITRQEWEAAHNLEVDVRALNVGSYFIQIKADDRTAVQAFQKQ